MAEGLRIAPMSPADLTVALGWAAAEGWNPGLDDATAFLSADPEGFLMGWLGETPVAAISVVRHSAAYGFLGLYLVHPDHRGRGYGWAIWQAGIAHLGKRTVGLDGVPAQQANYARSGFAFAFRSDRYEGVVPGCAHAGYVPLEPKDLDEAVALDAVINGASRPAYIRVWLQDTETRRTLVRHEEGRVVALGTIRACRIGHKLGPVIAPDAETARCLIESLAGVVGTKRIAIDIPETSETGAPLARHYGLVSAFSCARMYRLPAPVMDHGRLVGLTSFELG